MELKTATETVLELLRPSSGAGALNKTCVPFRPTETMVADETVGLNLAG